MVSIKITINNFRNKISILFINQPLFLIELIQTNKIKYSVPSFHSMHFIFAQIKKKEPWQLTMGSNCSKYLMIF